MRGDVDMVKDIQTAIETYRKLDATGKRLFRAETGLESVKRRQWGTSRKATRVVAASTPRATRKPKQIPPPAVPTDLPVPEQAH